MRDTADRSAGRHPCPGDLAGAGGIECLAVRARRESLAACHHFDGLPLADDRGYPQLIRAQWLAGTQRVSQGLAECLLGSQERAGRQLPEISPAKPDVPGLDDASGEQGAASHDVICDDRNAYRDENVPFSRCQAAHADIDPADVARRIGLQRFELATGGQATAVDRAGLDLYFAGLAGRQFARHGFGGSKNR